MSDIVEDAVRPQFTIRRNVTLSSVIVAGAVVLAVAFLVRRAGGWDYAFALVLGLVALLHVPGLFAGRAPLLEADGAAVVIRVGRGWQRLPWGHIRQVVIERPDSPLRDGRLVVLPRDPSDLVDVDLFKRLHMVWSRRWYGAPLSVPLSIATTSSHADVLARLGELADGRCEVVMLRGRHLASLSEAPVRADTSTSRTDTDAAGDLDAAVGPAPANAADAVTEPDEPAVPDVILVEPVAPSRQLQPPSRVEITLEAPTAHDEPDPEPAALVVPTPAVPTPPSAPVIGPVLRIARQRIGLSIDDLSERTRIRPHVIEAIEQDDFDPCGGDFYARGHLTTLARVLGVELDPLMAEYDARYSLGPINARRVFEAELATGLSGGMRSTAGGPKWSLLLGAVLCLALVWGVAQMFSSSPQEVAAPTGDRAGLTSSHRPITSPLMRTKRMTVTAAHAATTVVVRDRTGRILWSGQLAQGEHRQIAGVAPFQVQADNAGAVEVMVLGRHLGTIGVAGAPGHKKFG